MRTTIAQAALLATTTALTIEATPDAFGPNGANYTNTAPTVDMSKIGIDISKQGDGDFCSDGKWAKIGYKAFLTNGQQIMDSQAVDGKDLIFSVGASQTFKCLDLAMTQLKPGASAKIHCPAEFVYGGARVQAPLGGDWIPAGSDMDFEVNVSFCNHSPQTGDPYMLGDDYAGVKELKPGNCVMVQTRDPYERTWPIKASQPDHWYCWHTSYTYCSSGSGELKDLNWMTSTNGHIFKMEKGLDGASDSVSFIPQINGLASGMYMKADPQWGGYLTVGSGTNDHFKKSASWTPKKHGDGSWTISVNAEDAVFKGKNVATWGGTWFEDDDYYLKSSSGNKYLHTAEVVDCPV